MTGIQWARVEPKILTPCRVTVNMVGARVGETVNVNLSLPQMQELVEGGMLVPVAATPAAPIAAAEVAPDAVEAPEASQEPPGADATVDATSDTPTA